MIQQFWVAPHLGLLPSWCSYLNNFGWERQSGSPVGWYVSARWQKDRHSGPDHSFHGSRLRRCRPSCRLLLPALTCHPTERPRLTTGSLTTRLTTGRSCGARQPVQSVWAVSTGTGCVLTPELCSRLEQWGIAKRTWFKLASNLPELHYSSSVSPSPKGDFLHYTVHIRAGGAQYP